MRTGVTLHEDAVKDRVLRIVNPMLVSDFLAADSKIHATHRDVAQLRCSLLDFDGASSPMHLINTGSGMVLIRYFVRQNASVHQFDGVCAGIHSHDFAVQARLIFHVREEAVHERLEAALQRITKSSVRTHGFGDRAQRTFDHLFEIWKRNTPTPAMMSPSR